jgi:hypothetical protein
MSWPAPLMKPAWRHHTTPNQVEAILGRRPNAPGAAKLRRVLRGDAKVTLSKLESAFLAMLRNERLPLPETNRPPAGTASTAAGRSSS